jgi:hypothetical protein
MTLREIDGRIRVRVVLDTLVYVDVAPKMSVPCSGVVSVVQLRNGKAVAKI